MKALIEIRAPGVAPIRRELGSETLVIGKKPTPGMNAIAIPSAQDLSDEHLIVSFVRDRFHVALASGARIEPALNGKSFRQAEIAFGDEVQLGKTSIRFLGKAKSNAPSPVLVIGFVAVVGVVLWAMFDEPVAPGLNASLPPPPALFGPDIPCPYTGPQAAGRGSEAEQAAMAHGERYSFDPHDGIEAVLAYRMAAMCYAAGGDAASAARARTSGQRWQTRLEGQYQGHQLRLRVALDRGRNDHALTEVRSLARILRGRNGPYIEWLAAATRELEAPPAPE
jgi:hypothetical protein